MNLENAKKESKENVSIIEKHYKDFASPGYSKIFFVFDKLPFKKIIIEYKDKEIKGKFEILK